MQSMRTHAAGFPLTVQLGCTIIIVMMLLLLLQNNGARQQAMAQDGPYQRKNATDFVYERCHGVTYDLSDTSHSYVANFRVIKTVFLSESSTARYTRVASTRGSSTSNYMYAIFQCRGDASYAQCSACVAAALSVSFICGRGRRQLAACFFRYSQFPFDDENWSRSVWNTTCAFSSDTSSLFTSNLAAALSASTAAAPTAHDFFYVSLQAGSDGSTTSTAHAVYALAQCSGHLTPTSCSDCLVEASTQYSTICLNSVGGNIFMYACFLIVSKSPDFLFNTSVVDSGSSSPPPSSELTPPPPSTPPPTSPPPPPSTPPPTSSQLTPPSPPPPTSSQLTPPSPPPPTSSQLTPPSPPPPTSSQLTPPSPPPPTSSQLTPPSPPPPTTISNNKSGPVDPPGPVGRSGTPVPIGGSNSSTDPQSLTPINGTSLQGIGGLGGLLSLILRAFGVLYLTLYIFKHV